MQKCLDNRYNLLDEDVAAKMEKYAEEAVSKGFTYNELQQMINDNIIDLNTTKTIYDI